MSARHSIPDPDLDGARQPVRALALTPQLNRNHARHIMIDAPGSPSAGDPASMDMKAPSPVAEQASSAEQIGQAAAPSGSKPTLVTISRSLIPPSMSYDAYIVVYRSLLGWVKQLALSPPSHPARLAELAFLNDHHNLQRCVAHSRVVQGSLRSALLF